LADRYGWYAVFGIAVGLNITAGLLIIFIVKPMRRAFILQSEPGQSLLPRPI
jgi:OFA family oxalate/formate antiporter-like MFS transporter